MRIVRSQTAAASALVRRHQDRLAAVGQRRAADRKTDRAVVRVEVAGRLVGEHDRRPVNDRARDRRALQSGRRRPATGYAPAFSRDADRRERIARRAARFRARARPCSTSGKRDVVRDVSAGSKLKN